jgi:hypothetical protein
MARHLAPLNRALLLLAGGHVDRLQLNLPPRHGKTQLAAVWFPLWYLITFPDRQVLYATHSEGLAREVGERVRDLYAEWAPSLAGQMPSETHRIALDWRIASEGGGMRSLGVGAAVHGYGANLIVLDDLFASIQQALSPTIRETVARWYHASILTRLAPGGAIVHIGTPTHRDDLFGRLERAEESGGERWLRLRLPAVASGADPLGRAPGEALWPEQYGADALEKIRATLTAAGNAADWKAQYLLDPPAGDGASTWPAEYFRNVWWEGTGPGPHERIRRVLAVDTSRGESAVGDFQAFVLATLDQRGHFWIEAELVRLDDARLLDFALDLLARWAPDLTVVETNGAGYVLANQLSRATVNGLTPAVLGRQHVGKESKHTRITARLTSQLAAGKLHFRRGQPGCTLLVDQLQNYPHGIYDDGPDSLEMALELHGQMAMPPGHPARCIPYTSPGRQRVRT